MTTRSDLMANAVGDGTAQRYVARIETHLARLVQGHDPLGHLFAIERLARAERSERLDALHRLEPRSPRL